MLYPTELRDQFVRRRMASNLADICDAMRGKSPERPIMVVSAKRKGRGGG
jgi:hypothetical protein